MTDQVQPCPESVVLLLHFNLQVSLLSVYNSSHALTIIKVNFYAPHSVIFSLSHSTVASMLLIASTISASLDIFLVMCRNMKLLNLTWPYKLFSGSESYAG